MNRLTLQFLALLCFPVQAQEVLHPANSMMQMAADFARDYSTEMRLRAALDVCAEGRGSRLFEARRLQRQLAIEAAAGEKTAELSAANALGDGTPELYAQMMSSGISAALVFFENGYFQAMQATFAILADEERTDYCSQLDSRAVDLLAR